MLKKQKAKVMVSDRVRLGLSRVAVHLSHHAVAAMDVG